MAMKFNPVEAGLVPWGPKPSNIPERDFVACPLQPGWKICSWRVVNGKIPDPIPYESPSWAGDRGVWSADGRVFDYLTGEEMHDHNAPRGAPIFPRPALAPGALANTDKKYRR